MTDKNVPDGSLGQQAHYAGGIEPIEAIEAWGLGFHLGSALKYIARAGKKTGETRQKDLTKALWYLRRCAQMGVVDTLSTPTMFAGKDTWIPLDRALDAWKLPPLLARAVDMIYSARQYRDRVRCVEAAATFVDSELAL